MIHSTLLLKIIRKTWRNVSLVLYYYVHSDMFAISQYAINNRLYNVLGVGERDWDRKIEGETERERKKDKSHF